ncbi:MAG: aspartate dehydrogenase [Lachnospiraceae bacterium]|nr:aspartate dehydrogenase [Lachnospiraceae bacterium]
MFTKKITKQSYNKAEQKPIIRSSICTGEKVAGFKDLKTGHFTEVMAIKSNKDLDSFLEQYDIEVAEIKTEY